MKREWRRAGLALGLALISASAAAIDAGSERPDPVLIQAHPGYDSGTAMPVPAAIAASAHETACGPDRSAIDRPDETARVAWRDRPRRVHGSGLIDNCIVTPEPDDRDGGIGTRAARI